jgi:hypothetical protein
MPTILTETATFDATVPTPDDGEGATGAGLDGMAQPLANRTQYLKAKVDADGVPRIARSADITALKAVTGMVTEDLRYVPGNGLYRFDSASATGELLPWVVQPNAGSGRWHHMLDALRGTNLATLTGGQLEQSSIYQTIATVHAFDAGIGTTLFSTAGSSFITSGTYGFVDVPNCIASDILIIDAQVTLTAGGTPPTNFTDCRLRVSEDNAGTPTPVDIGQTRVRAYGAGLHSRSLHARHVITDPGTARIQLAIADDGGSTGGFGNPWSIRCIHVRP